MLETPGGSSPTPQFLTFSAAPGAAQLSPQRTRCHQLSPFFHPVSFGARKPCFGGRRPVASTPFTTMLRPNREWVTLPRGLISHQPFRFDAISPFSKPCSPPWLQIFLSLGGPGCSAWFGSDQPCPGLRIPAPSTSLAPQRCWKLGEAGCWPGCCTEAQEKAKGDEGGTVPAVQRELLEGFVLSIPLPSAPLQTGRI